MSEHPYRGRPYGSEPYPPQQQQYAPQYPQQPQQWQSGGSYDPYGSYGGYADDLVLAPILRRAGARLLDNALVAVFGFAVVLPVTFGAIGFDDGGSKTKTEGGIWNWPILFTLFAVLAVLPFIYEAIQLSLWGQTLGKRVLGLRVVQANPAGDPLPLTQGIWRAAINNLGYQLGFFFFLTLSVMVWDYAAYGLLLVSIGMLMAYLWAIWDQPLRQAVHDRFAGTIVIDDRGEYE